MAGGVFITVKVDSKRIREDLQYLKVGSGKYFTFFRLYHLWFIEAPISIAKAHLYRETTLVPQDKAIAESMTIAKADLKPGDQLDTFGGYTFYGLMDRAEEAIKVNALPTGLAPGAKIIKDVVKGQVITWDDVTLSENSLVVELRRKQDLMEVTL
jgi:predicted homoserine dehydrogenase-like protein